jgi:hypothetical protein
VAARLTLLESMEGGEQRSAYIHAWILKETTRELAEKAKQQISLHPVENDEDDRVVGDGTMPAPAVHREEVAIKTVVASMVHKGNLEEAQHGTPGMDKTEGRVIEIQLPPPAVCNTDPGDLAGVKEKRILDLVYLNGYVPFCTQRVQGTLVPCSTKHFAVFENGDRTRRAPLDTKGHQTLERKWGLGRVRPQESEAVTVEDPSPPDTAPVFVAFSHLSGAPLEEGEGYGRGSRRKAG